MTVESQVAKLMEWAPLAASASLTAGLCWTVGTCLPLGADAFYYLSASDFLRSALICVPITLICAPVFLAFLLFRPNDRATEYTRELIEDYHNHGRRSVYVVAFIREALYHLPIIAILSFPYLIAPSKFEVEFFFGVYFVVVLVGTVTFANLNNMKRRALAVVSMYLGILMLFSCLYQVSVLRKAEQSPSDSICIGDKCRQGTVVARFSEGSFIWWGGATAISIVPNDQITSIEKLGDGRLKPLWDLKPAVRSLFGPATNP